jgi:hypothetical protein
MADTSGNLRAEVALRNMTHFRDIELHINTTGRLTRTYPSQMERFLG